MLALWAARLFINPYLSKRGNGPFYCLTCFVLLGAIQLLTLPANVISAVSPGSAEIVQFYLPDKHEVLPGEAAGAAKSFNPLSVSPGDSREFLMNALAMASLYGVVLHNLTSANAFTRFAWVSAVNGVLVCLLAFALRISNHGHVLFWLVPPAGSADFGPFESRNTFPFFINPCIGLTLGLLLAGVKKVKSVLHDGSLIWLFAAVALMLTALAFSFSRGGMLAMIAALVFGVVFSLRSGRQLASLGQLLWLLPVVFVAMGWLGWSALEQRYERLFENRVDVDARYKVWQDSLNHFTGSPMFGTGNGSFRVVEPLTRTTIGAETVDYDNAHNEYVEALVEGGVPRLLVTLALIGSVTFAGVRNYRRCAGRTLSWLILGGLVGFWAITLHSFVDFGIHYPSIAITVVVLMAQLANARTASDEADRGRVPYPVALILAALLIGLGGCLVNNGILADRAHRHRVAANAEDGSTTESALRRVAYLETAVRSQPRSYSYRFDLSQAYYDAARMAENRDEAKRLLRESLRAAAATRDLAPTFAKPHVRLALLRDQFQEAQQPIWYLERAVRSAPSDPMIWFACGKHRYDSGDFDGAWRDWKRSLALRDTFLDPIFKDAFEQITPFEILDKVLPERPELIYKVAQQIIRDSGLPSRLLAPYFKRALELLDQREANRSAKDEMLRGILLQNLNRPAESIVAFQHALEKDPAMIDCRLKLANQLYESSRFEEAAKEAMLVLNRDPFNQEAKELVAVLERELELLK